MARLNLWGSACSRARPWRTTRSCLTANARYLLDSRAGTVVGNPLPLSDRKADIVDRLGRRHAARNPIVSVPGPASLRHTWNTSWFFGFAEPSCCQNELRVARKNRKKFSLLESERKCELDSLSRSPSFDIALQIRQRTRGKLIQERSYGIKRNLVFSSNFLESLPGANPGLFR